MGDSILQTNGLTLPRPMSLLSQGDRASHQGREKNALYIKERAPTASPFGLTSAEVNLLSSGAYELLRRDRKLVFLTTTIVGLPERSMRERIRHIRSMATSHQTGDYGLPHPEWVEVLQWTPALHSHIILAAPDTATQRHLIRRLNGSETYKMHAQSVYNLDGLISVYLLNEATPQAKYKRRFKRLKKGEREPAGIGDRVRLSRELERTLIERGLIEPRRRTYASRKIPSGDIRTELIAVIPMPSWQRIPAVQYSVEAA